MIDVAVATTPFLDITFSGLDALPQPGQERYARQLHRSAGGGAITAVGAARLGLRAALAGPLGSDGEGALLRDDLEREGVTLVAPHAGPTATTVVLPTNCDRAMVTYDPGARARAQDLAELAPRALVCGLEEQALAPPGTAVYLTLGDEEARALAGAAPASIGGAHAIVLNESEALRISGADDAAGGGRRARPGSARRSSSRADGSGRSASSTGPRCRPPASTPAPRWTRRAPATSSPRPTYGRS